MLHLSRDVEGTATPDWLGAVQTGDVFAQPDGAPALMLSQNDAALVRAELIEAHLAPQVFPIAGQPVN